MLVDAASELRGSGLDRDQIVTLCRAALRHDVNLLDLRPRGATAQDPRPFTALLQPTTSDGPDVSA